MIRRGTFIVSIFLGLYTPVVLAQDETAETLETVPELTRYNVEVIIFAHTDVDPGEERFRENEPQLEATSHAAPAPATVIAVESFGLEAGGSVRDRNEAIDEFPEPAPVAIAGTEDSTESIDPDSVATDDALDFLDPFGTLAATAGATDRRIAADGRPEIRVLGPDELTLGDARNTIDRLGAYRLLGYGGWQQVGREQSEAPAFDISALGIANPTGTIQLYLGRFLHVSLDLDYRDFSAQALAVPPIGQAENAPLPGASSFRPALQAIGLPAHFALKIERNAIRSDELHYIDHPRFGVLILVTRAPTSEEAGSDPSGSELPAA